jgi:cytoskeletal protein CcmA (bactofilin family)
MRFNRNKSANEIVSHIGKGAEVTGEVSFASEMLVDGIIKGKVNSEAVLVIGPGGKVDAEVNIRKISISGEFHGIIRASDRVEIHKEGKVFGEIFTPCLIIEAGALFEGRCTMGNSQKAAAKKEDFPLPKQTEVKI